MKTALLALTIALTASMTLAADDLVDNPAYKQWATCKAGSYVKLAMTTEMAEANMKATITMTLKEITAEQAVIEVATEMSMQGKTMSMPAQTQTIKAKVPKDQAGPTAAPEGATVTKKGEGDEEITVGGKKYKCHWQELDLKGKAAAGTMKVWTAGEIPGGVVKSVMNSTAPAKSTMTMELVEFKSAN